jgi:hypothetical protein
MRERTSPAKGGKGGKSKGGPKPVKVKKAKAPVKDSDKVNGKTKPSLAEASPSPRPRAVSAQAAASFAAASMPTLDLPALTGEQRAVVEKLSMTLARAALTAQGARSTWRRRSPRSWAASPHSPIG